ncbi:DUF317 domain-containing protein [Streptomyces pinistramenti]|uniref:DUF317 domain-containing protein n=1 Tax=Streptomyces pinistramenti TaxID=2884812 RepID=UPI001D05CB2A|nr:DUF317 domain-containing protein [Streptomyces pinistramenti]MCB5905894.1 DUF317 domain-containing protein [Streptomyces pinistramenti]
MIPVSLHRREAPLHPHHSLDPHAPQPSGAYWVTPRHLAGDDGLLADQVSVTLSTLGWADLTIVRGRREVDEPEEVRQVLRSTVLHLRPDTLAWAQWVLADEPFHLGELPVPGRSPPARTPAALRSGNAYFTGGVPHEALSDFLLALDARPEPASGFDGPDSVLAALAGQGWVLDIDAPDTAAADPGFTSSFTLCWLPALIQDGEPSLEPVGWQTWAQPVLGAPYLWCAAFSASVPHDLVAAFASSLSSPVPVLRRVLPESAEGRLTLTPAP